MSAAPSEPVEYCTVCDRGFLVKTLVLHRSLLRHAPSFRLTVFCLDDDAKRILDLLALPQLDAVPMAELEAFDPELAAVKGDRSLAEYSWTSKASMINFLFDRHPGTAIVGYLDADQMFFSDPKPMFDELGEDSVLITPHDFAPEYSTAIGAGIYNAGFVAFRGDERARIVLDDWRELCLEWCYHRHEPTRSGDQKYLDYWPERFEGIHALEHPGAGLAPWNVSLHRVRAGEDGIRVDDGPLIFFHFHRVELRSRGGHEFRPGGYHIPRQIRRLVYRPYLDEIDAELAEVRRIEPGFDGGLVARPAARQRLNKGVDEARLSLLALAKPLRRLDAGEPHAD